MVDRHAEEDKPDKETIEQCASTLSMSDGDSVFPFSNMDSLFAYASQAA